MSKSKLFIAAFVAAPILTACVAPSSDLSSRAAMEQQQQRRWDDRVAAIKAEPYIDRYPEGSAWKTSCRNEPVYAVKVCSATASARPMLPSGTPFGSSTIPVSITYTGKTGPTLSVGTAVQPGTDPVVRIDEGAPVMLRTKADSSNLIAQIKAGQLLRATYVEWPEKQQSLHLSLSGAALAIEQLESMRDK